MVFTHISGTHLERQSITARLSCVITLLIISVYSAVLAAASVPRFAYVPNSFHMSVSIYSVDANSGRLHFEGYEHIGDKLLSEALIHPNGRFLYVISQTFDRIRIYRINSTTGQLQEIPESPVPSIAHSPFSAVFSTSGTELYVPGRHSNGLTSFKVNSKNGALTPINELVRTQGERSRFAAISNDNKWVFVSHAHSHNISVLEFKNDKLGLELVEGSPFTSGLAPQAMLVHPTSGRLFVPMWLEHGINIFEFDDKSKQLQKINSDPFPAGIFPHNGAIHPNGKYLYVANWISWDISSYTISDDMSSLSKHSNSPVSTGGSGPATVSIDATGQFAYVPHYESHNISMFKIDQQDGQLHPSGIIQSHSGPRRVAILHGDKPVVRSLDKLIAFSKEMNEIRVYDAGKGSTLLSNITLNYNADKVMLSKNGKYLYIISSKDASLHSYRVTKSGQLQALDNSPYLLPAVPTDLLLEQNGRYLAVLVTGQKSYLVFKINPLTGQLREDVAFLLDKNFDPGVFIEDPMGRYIIMADKTQPRLSFYRQQIPGGPIETEMKLFGSPFKINAVADDVAYDANGRFAFVVHSQQNTLSILDIPIHRGVLSENQYSPVSTGKRPVSVVANPFLDCVYVLNQGDRTIVQYKYDWKEGKLTEMNKHIVVSGALKLQIDPAADYLYVLAEGQRKTARYQLDSVTGKIGGREDIDMGKAVSKLQFVSNIH